MFRTSHSDIFSVLKERALEKLRPLDGKAVQIKVHYFEHPSGKSSRNARKNVTGILGVPNRHEWNETIGLRWIKWEDRFWASAMHREYGCVSHNDVNVSQTTQFLLHVHDDGRVSLKDYFLYDRYIAP